MPRHQAAGLTPHVVRAAAGALEHLPVARVGNLGQALERLKQEGCWVIGAVAEAREAKVIPAPWAVDFRGPLVLVLGSEGRGIRPLVARTCDVLVSIPLAGQVGASTWRPRGRPCSTRPGGSVRRGAGRSPGGCGQEWG